MDHGVGDEALEAAGHDHMEVLAGLHHLRVEGLCFGKEEAACSMCQRTRCEPDLRIVAERIVGEHEQGPVVHGTELAKDVVKVPPDPDKGTWNMSGNAASPLWACWTLMRQGMYTWPSAPKARSAARPTVVVINVPA